MEPFRILFVDDDLTFMRVTSDKLQRDRAQLTDSISRPIVIDVATTQEEADQKIFAPDAGNYELVLLDMRYPQDAIEKDQKNRDFGYLGVRWLPILRKARPHVVVAVLTAYGHDDHLSYAVEALVHGDADEFIPKGAPWLEMLARLRKAIRSRRESRQLSATANPLLSNVARTSSEDIHCALSRARAQLERFAVKGSATEARVFDGVNQVFENLQAEIDAVTERLTGRIDRTASEVTCRDLVAEQALIFEAQLKSTIPIECIGDSRVVTYPEDLRIAILELLQNATDAVLESGEVREDAVSVRIAPVDEPKGVSIEVRDRGTGFSPNALDSKFTPGASFWTLDVNRHRGMGLYVARRMMYSIGGDLEIAGGEHSGTAVRLTIRDWGAR